MVVNAVGIYEKALPGDLSWEERFDLVHELGFNFLEFSVDESDERLLRLDWDKHQREEFRTALWKTNSRINTLMLSGHRRFPLGSADARTREISLDMMRKAIDLASDLGIRNIQLAGYDVYYEHKSLSSREYFVENLKKCVQMAAKKMVMLSIETMDDPFINSMDKAVYFKSQIRSPWLQAYPDIGNLSAWENADMGREIESYIDNIVAVHLKETKPVTAVSPGAFRDVPFGEGSVDFEAALRMFKRLEYSGSFTVEMWKMPSGDPIAQVRAAKAFFDAIFEKVGIEQEPIPA
ncbi:L-ribulose-5-phosphate 3-epimerase [Bifidobacterium psychraerophilum]|uniref:L-ribulose-5-phosphate 3-epimerase n=1 Tax=Bifidobacterium psychraerophilum TaxID=218140 RepID=A0A087CI55_9BIFI|nr:L-ribulose-5-phosphate 3-epimerase [Bifidobacterium psychraerophilum]KFI82955.1 L-ribulose-5-phosphate 3-epimerase [Bifidobacterium psychraerophilum]PKA94703.1 L-ribulose-5-phosphate 3-epimerase/hexulose-6-phosphate isomerase [Bifidobacterium psychraerophilum DSM 22366]